MGALPVLVPVPLVVELHAVLEAVFKPVLDVMN